MSKIEHAVAKVGEKAYYFEHDGDAIQVYRFGKGETYLGFCNHETDEWMYLYLRATCKWSKGTLDRAGARQKAGLNV